MKKKMLNSCAIIHVAVDKVHRFDKEQIPIIKRKI